MDGREAPGAKTVRLGIEKRIIDHHNAGDSTHVNMGLDHWPHGKERQPLGVVAIYQLLKRKGRPAARFFEKQATAEAAQPTEEIPIITQEMVDAGVIR